MPRKAPIRTCIACGATSDKRELLRFVRTPDKQVSCDVSGRAAGRGAYVCRDGACFAQVVKKRLFDSRLRVRVSADDYARLKEEFNAACDGTDGSSRDGE